MTSKSPNPKKIPFCLTGNKRVTNIPEWGLLVSSQWPQLVAQVKDLPIKSSFHRFLALMLIPMKPDNKQQADLLANFLEENNLVGARQMRSYGNRKDLKSLTVKDLVMDVFTDEVLDPTQKELRKQLFSRTALASATHEELFNIVIMLCKDSNAKIVQIDRVTSEKDVIIAENFINKKDDSHKNAMTSYLHHLLLRWDHVDFSNILPDPMQHFHTHLHQLYIPLDVWMISPTDTDNAEKLDTLQQKSITHDYEAERKSLVESINDSRLHVIVGGPGTGKSTACGFIATGLAYACDLDAQMHEGVSGLGLLGGDWNHGAMLPVYVRLRHFATSTEHFPKTLQQANSECLLKYIKAQHEEFSAYFVNHFADRVEGLNGAMLILDGLDEIYDLKQRGRVKKVIEHFAKSFPTCRIIVTCRTAVYSPHHPWYLSDNFTVAEIAPYTREQIRQYVEQWYDVAKDNRPNSLGGIEFAAKNALKLSNSLSSILLNHDNLLSLARQPLLLTLLVLVHEKNQQLPENRATLYENTVTLLNRWNPPDDEDPLSEKMRDLNLNVVREVLQHVAFNFQRDDKRYKDNRPQIKQKDLIEQLLAIKDGVEKDLGAGLDDVLEYLATRNGILVVDQNTSYRFLHLSIREYLAACALIEQYNELKMPAKLKPSHGEWTFPDNIYQLLSSDPYRWREVALFCGAILGNDKGQDRLWVLVETLLPEAKISKGEEVDAKDLHRIEIAGQIWLRNNMRARLPSHQTIAGNLRDALSAIIDDKRFDVPEHSKIEKVLNRIKSSS